MHPRFRKAPKPDDEIVQAIERALVAAKEGRLRSVLIVGVDPLHRPESISAGDLGPGFKASLLGALAQAAHQLLDIIPK